LNTTALARQVFTVEALLEEAVLQLQELPDDAPEAEREAIALRVADYLSATEQQRDRFCEFLAYVEGLEAAAKAEEDRLADRRRSLSRARKRLEAMAVRAMEARGGKKLEGITHTLALRKSPGKLEHDGSSTAAVPNKYREYIVRVPGEAWEAFACLVLTWMEERWEPRAIIGGATWIAKNDAIKADLKAGIDVPGYSIATPNNLKIS
jgi:hypothetical protein